ncbi:MAG: L-alanine-DL-glutamate epimerase-like enolase superfamily enzyme [Gammaproteobacteria bacterium]|jgi:L-alanine-DL-glutamate epimerase-like enolase superfamily enzyme
MANHPGHSLETQSSPLRVDFKSMKIIEIEVYQVNLPIINGPYTYSGGALHHVDSTVVKLMTDNGLVGYGECCPCGPTYAAEHGMGARAALAEMAAHLTGENPLNRNLIHANMENHLCGHAYAKAAIDIALWDIAGKHYGARVCDLIGGALSENVMSYYTTGSVSPDEAVRIAQDKYDQGFRRLQIKVGGRPVDIDIEVIRKVYQAVGPGMRLAADANRSWTARDTLFASDALSGIPVVFEQPCDSLDEIAIIRGQIRHPIYLDESSINISTVITAAGQGLCDGFGFKLTRMGGISAMIQARDICKARHLPHSCDDAWGGDIIAAACLHVGATVSPELNEGVWIAEPYIEGHYDAENGIRIIDGNIALPTGPGLGITPDLERLGDAVAVYP